MDWKKPAIREDGAIKVPSSWLYLHYYDAMSALFRVENALRMFVYVVLKAGRQGKWTELTLTSDDGGDTTIAAIAKRRLSQDEKFGYLGHRVSSPLMHLTSGELTRVIFTDAYWPLFAAYFPAQKEIVRTKLEEIGNIRNALAHFRPIKPDDVEVVKQNANQVLSRVEELLSNVSYLSQTVPTNTADQWYTSLKSLQSPLFAVSFQQDDSGRWIQLRLSHQCPLISTNNVIDNYTQWRVLTLISPNVIRNCDVIRDNVIYAFESVPSVSSARAYDGENTPTFKKYLDLVFSRHVLAEKHDEIRRALDDLFTSVANESDLLLQDTLARGTFVRSGSVSGAKAKSGRWNFDESSLHTPSRGDEPVEYWSRKPSTSENLVTDTERYPWMTVDVSEEEEVPF